MKKLFVRLGLVLLFFSCTALAFGSQVADVAKKEKERRQKIATPAKVFTNKDIADFKAKNKESDTISSDSASSEEASSDQGEATTEDSGTNSAAGNSRDEQYWRNRFQEATKNVSDLQAQADKLQKGINGLLLNSPSYEGVAAGPQINAQLGDMKNQLEQLNNAIAEGKKAVEDLQEEARKAGADPGWVRE